MTGWASNKKDALWPAFLRRAGRARAFQESALQKEAAQLPKEQDRDREQEGLDLILARLEAARVCVALGRDPLLVYRVLVAPLRRFFGEVT
jgi:hypothetical protein